MSTIVVTGASRGVGLALTRRLLELGHQVVAANRTFGPDLCELAERYPGRLAFEHLDLSRADEVQDTGRRIAKTYKDLYGVVNNAASGGDQLFALMSRGDIEGLVQTNLLGPILLTRQLLQPMLLKRRGRIILTSSVNARTGYSGLSVYGATKAGLEGFMRSLSREIGKRGVTINCVAPGYMPTALTSGLTGDRLASVLRRSPLGVANPDDVAAAMVYLLSDGAAKVTGTVLTVDGGSTA
ncbi:SDR family NAD(P)-dependent oxidoreductase [Novosphingobium cyanobacteriorum]|uniref:SDR family oxidoreductase n=1 Tax=Novosphingobium cyanobacteriorum TaxID=3024215 RepID=A0ABT6CMP8_9SPHN|nr:SDR family oxidoreductase [Novosphingobium cyanobacteriorum]MDF8335182.1 SDR family oxidoreductase [Novosphingobium cyanobacteriorum]